MRALACLICVFLVTVVSAADDRKTLNFVTIQSENDASKINYPNLKELSLIKPNINNLTAAMLYQLKSANAVAFIWGTVTTAFITPQFKQFSINECNLKSLTIDPNLDYQMTILVLDKNNLTALPEHFNALKKLQFINIEYNQIESLNAEDFNGFNQLQRMSLAHNKIARISSSPTHPTVLPVLNQLYLRGYIYLRNVSFANWSGPSMTRLHMNDNQLVIAQSVFEAFPNVQLLDIEKNPLNCGWLAYVKNQFKGKDHYLGDRPRCTETGESMEQLIERINRK